jgi:NNP family nitrate/nitrite transporter-like MFS transporter
MLLFVLVAAALAWMHFAIRRMERRHFPQIDRETDLPEAIDAAAAERVRGRPDRRRCRPAAGTTKWGKG